MKGKEEAIFKFLFFLVLFKYCQKLVILKFLFLFYFVIIFYCLFSHQLPAQPLFLIVLHNGIKQYSREKGMICEVVSEQRIAQNFCL